MANARKPNWLVVFEYATVRYAAGHILSRHRTYDLARAAAKRSGFDSFLAIREAVKQS